MNHDRLRRSSIERWEAICGYLSPTGHREGWRWLTGSSLDEPSRFVDVNLRTAIFGDWAAEDIK